MFSALPLIADIAQCSRHVRFVPCTHSRVVMRRCLGIDHGPPVTYQYVILGSKSVLLSAFSRAKVPSSSIPIRRQEPATSAARIAASRRSTCSLPKVAPMLGEIECGYSRIVSRCPAMPKSEMGQKLKSSMRANVFRFAFESRHHVTHAVCPFRACQKRTWWACRTLSVKTLNVDARQGGIASRGGRDAERVDCVRHSAVRVFPHVHHHRGDRHAYPADPEKREGALLAPLNVLFSCHCR